MYLLQYFLNLTTILVHEIRQIAWTLNAAETPALVRIRSAEHTGRRMRRR